MLSALLYEISVYEIYMIVRMGRGKSGWVFLLLFLFWPRRAAAGS